jgi:integrase
MKPTRWGALADLYEAAGYPGRNGMPKTALAGLIEKTRIARLRPVFGRTKLEHLGLLAAIEYGRSQTGRLRAAEMELDTLSSTLSFAVLHGWIPVNPILRRPKLQSAADVRHCREVMPADGDELHRIARVMFSDTASEATGWQMLFEALTGCRTSEILSLRMDAASKTSPGYIEGRYLYVRRLKSGRFPFVELHPALSTAIEWHRRWHADRFGDTSPFWFPGKDLARPLNRVALTHRLAVVCKRLGIAHRTSHGMRAYFVTVMRSRGKSNEQVAALIGDRTSSLIESTYGALPEVWSGGEPLDWMPRDGVPAWQVFQPTPETAPCTS